MQDKIMPSGKWEFDEDVANVFDDMLSRSIPMYNAMRDIVFAVGRNYVQRKTAIVDIGCSNGNAIKPFVDKFGAYNTYRLYDVSEPMLRKAKEKYSDYVSNGLMCIEHYDLRNGIESINASLVLSVLTLQFVPIEYRQKIVRSIYRNLESGGAFILVEKVLGNSADLDDMLVREYYDLKRGNAYTDEQISSKRKSLEGVLVPITARWNESLLHDAGFREVDCIWRYLNFAAWIAVR